MPFMQSLELSKLLFDEQIEPMMKTKFPNLPYAAASLGMCSEILGLDDEVSKDHEWGPRITVYLKDSDFKQLSEQLEKTLNESLPTTFHGQKMMWRKEGVDIHNTTETALYHIYVNTVTKRLGFCGGSLPQDDAGWLRISEQHLLEFTSGKVYKDDVGELTKARQMLSFYPKSVLSFILMNEWSSVGIDWFPIGRIGSRGDRLGLRLQASKIAETMMKIAFHASGKYCSYKKWNGTLFRSLPIFSELEPLLNEIINEENWQALEEKIGLATNILLAHQNRLGLTDCLSLKGKKETNGRHFINYDFWEISSKLKKNLSRPLLAILDNQVFWLDERNLILWNHETGKWPIFLLDNK